MNNFFENNEDLKKVLDLLKNSNYDGIRQITGYLISMELDFINNKRLEGYLVNNF